MKPSANTADTPAFSPEELARRRRAATRLAWAIGTAVLAVYLLGMFIPR